MLGALLFLGALGVSGVLALKDNIDSLSEPVGQLKDGTPTYMDRKGKEYINGEPTRHESVLDEFGHWHEYDIGVNSGKIYRDSFRKFMEEQRRYDNQNLENSKKRKKLAYEKYDPRFDRNITTEISTGKLISVLYESPSENIYRKFYHPDKIYKVCYDPTVPREKYGFHLWPLNVDYNQSMEGDFGIPISKEEYAKLDILFGSHGHCPKTIMEIGTDKDPYKDVRFDENGNRTTVQEMQSRK